MSKVLKRTPRTTTKAIIKSGRAAKAKHIEIYAKQITVTLTGANPPQLQAVTAAMLKAVGSHEYVKGGKTKSPVTMTNVRGKPIKVFDGIISPDTI